MTHIHTLIVNYVFMILIVNERVKAAESQENKLTRLCVFVCLTLNPAYCSFNQEFHTFISLNEKQLKL